MSSRRCLAAAAIALTATVFAADAWAACELGFRQVRDVRFRGSSAYDVFDPVETAQTVYFQVRHKKSDACSYFVTFSKGQAGTYDRAMSGPGTSDLNYQLYDAPSKSSILKEIPEATSGEVLSGTFTTTGNETQELSFYAAIPPEQMVLTGSYYDTITLRLYEGTLASYTLRDTASMGVATEVEQVIQMCVVGCGAPFDPFSKSQTMAFGVMHAGDSRHVDLLVRGNVNYEVEFSSENRGVMERLSGTGEVPYVMSLNGTPVDLSPNKVTVATGTGPTPTEGIRFHLEATIGDLATAVAGDYRDNIAITVRSQ